jgi:hypothetical protein
VIEQALAHAVGNAVERAYRRGDLFDKRRKLMEAWSVHCEKPVRDGCGDPDKRAVMKDDVTQGQDSFRDLTRQHCFWLLWPQDDPAWEWLYRVVWADVHQEPGPLKELLLLSAERPPKRAVPFVSDFLDRMTLGRTKRGQKVPLWNCPTLLEAHRRMVRQLAEEQGITVKAAVDQVLRMKLEPNRFWPTLDQWSPDPDLEDYDRDILYNYSSGKTGHGREKKQWMEELANPQRFRVGDDPASIK